MRIIFAGTPEFSVPPLRALLNSEHTLVGVYTRRDTEAGRGMKLKISPVKALALAHELPVYQPQHFRQDADIDTLRQLAPDLMVVVAYGLILPQSVLDIPRYGCINIHASLLPRWRGAAPIQRALLNGDPSSGITLMQMESGLDTGPMLLRKEYPIAAHETGGSLHDQLSHLGAEALMELLPAVEQGRLAPVAQDDRAACYAEKLQKQEAAIDWTEPALRIEQKIRAFNPWPSAETRYQDRILKIWQAEALAEPAGHAPGYVLEGRKTLDVATGDGILRLQEVQLPGGKRISAPAFMNAHSIKGTRLGEIA